MFALQVHKTLWRIGSRLLKYIIGDRSFFFFPQQQIMKRLIKRYVLKAQVDKENDEVNEGKHLQCEKHPFTTNLMNVEDFILKDTLKIQSRVTVWVPPRLSGESYVTSLKLCPFKETVI